MSTISDHSSAIFMAESLQVNRFITSIAFTILYYDYLVTFARELERFWRRARFSLVSILFVTNRYLGLLGQVPVFVEYFAVVSPQRRCRHLQRYHQYFTVLSQAIVGLILIMRTYTLYSRSRRVLIGLLSLGVLCLIATFVSVTVGPTVVTGPANTTLAATTASLGCDLTLTYEQGLRSAVGWICLLCLDTVVFVMTLVMITHLGHTAQEGVLLVLFRDGAIYYVILVAAYAANILTFVSPNVGDSDYHGIATTLANALATTLASRICLNLRDPKFMETRDSIELVLIEP